MQYLNAHEFESRFTEVTDAQGNLVRPDLTGIDPTSDRLWTVVDVDGNLHLVSGLQLRWLSAHRRVLDPGHRGGLVATSPPVP